MFLLLLLQLLKIPFLSSGNTSKKSDITLLLLGISLVLIPGISITAVIAALGGIAYAGCYSVYFLASLASKVVINTALATKYIITQPLYFIYSSFTKSSQKQQMLKELKDKIVTEEEVLDFKNMVREQIKNDSSKIYIVVREYSHADTSSKSREKVLNTLIIVLESEDTAATVLMLCKKKWSISKTQSLEIICKNSLVSLGTPLNNLQKNELGVVQLSLITMETFG